MPYPQRLVPKIDNRIIIDLKKEELLCRHVNNLYPLTDIQGRLNLKLIGKDKIEGMSYNKLPPSVTLDIKICFYNKDFFDQLWKEGDEGYNPTEKEYHIDYSRNFFLIQIKDIHNHEAQYPFPASKNVNEYNCRFIIKVCHKPNIANFSHCELDITLYDENDQIVRESRSNSRKIIRGEVRQYLQKIARFKPEDFFQVKY